MMLSQIASYLGLSCTKDVVVTGVSTDSRHITPGQLFVALRGEHCDGHDFIETAVAAGAVAVLCEQATQGLPVEALVVVDTLAALTRLAKAYREQCATTVVALTGSNGKTTVKEMIASILPKPSHATPGNLNNHIGVPLSVLQLQKEHRYAVFELGANHRGEIAHTVAIVQPDVALVNNIAPAHIEGFGSIDGVALAKGEIYQGLSSTGTAVVNDDDAYAHFWDEILTNKKIIRFSRHHAADIWADNVVMVGGRATFSLVTPLGRVDVQLQVPGLHNISNALAAAACTYALGISLADIAVGLNQFSGVSGRMTFLRGKHDALVIDDTYNANLRSSLAAIDVLAARTGRRIFVFGDMGELGSWSEAHHEEVGAAARHQGIDVFMTCGAHSKRAALAFGHDGKHYEHQDELVHDLLTQLDANTTILVKGSRSSRMEHIVHQLVE